MMMMSMMIILIIFFDYLDDDSGDKVDVNDDDHAHPLQMTRVDRAPHQSRA